MTEVNNLDASKFVEMLKSWVVSDPESFKNFFAVLKTFIDKQVSMQKSTTTSENSSEFKDLTVEDVNNFSYDLTTVAIPDSFFEDVIKNISSEEVNKRAIEYVKGAVAMLMLLK